MISLCVIKEKVLSISQLHALPSVALKVLELVDDPKTSTSTLGKLIATDQALTAKVLKIANSPFYGFPKKISTVEFAIIVLGYDALKDIIIGTSLVSSLQEDPGGPLNTRAIWDHAFASGVLARRLARDLGYRVCSEAFVGGLLHDIGISALRQHFSDEYQRIIGITRETDLTFPEAEESVLGVTHMEAGGWLAERWNLPDHLVEAVALHHTPAKAVRNPDLAALIHCADAMAYRIPGMDVACDKGADFDPEALNRLQINDPARLKEYIAGYAAPEQDDLARFAQSDIELPEGIRKHER